MTINTHSHRILLVITGGIAAYKSLDLIRRLREAGMHVRCVLTKGGAQFVTPLSVSALSGEKVYTDLWSLNDEAEMGHIRLARECDLVLVVPASADFIAKMAHGLADDLASTLLLANDRPVMIAPAMNGMMWMHPATQSNIATLRQRGVTIIGPASGLMACGEEGEGRMIEVTNILAVVQSHFSKGQKLRGKKALVTSGPTYEPLDPVRFLGNRSSGKQGHAIAIALAAAGADVTLITGPVALADPAGVKTIHIETATEMLAACQNALPADIFIAAAAVADWRPEREAGYKIKKSDAALSITFKENPDILATLSAIGAQRPRLVIGFAAETDHVLANAHDKFARKGCDWLLANDVADGKGFGTDDNQVTLLRKDKSGAITNEAWPVLSKTAIASKLVDEIADALA